ncbi:hypothetical protein ACFLVL_00930 [Chloroflexota bacterium]
MSKLEWSKVFQRKARCNPMKELGMPTWDLMRAAFNSGQIEEGNELLDYCHLESQSYFDPKIVMANMLLKYIGDNFGDDAVEEIWRSNLAPRIATWLETSKTAEESIIRIAEAHRGQFANLSISEEPDRYVIKLDPCGSGGKMRNTVEAASTKQAQPWSWNKAGIPYYCAHCCMIMEVLPIEMRGYPICVVEISENPEAPCLQYYYKNPELVPEEYFSRVGKIKDISKFKKS